MKAVVVGPVIRLVRPRDRNRLMLKLIFFGLACLTACGFAACAQYDRRSVVLCAGVLLANWLVCSMPWIYLPFSYEAVTNAIGMRQPQEDGWALADLLGLAATAWVGRRVWWGLFLPALYLGMLAMHVIAWSSSLQYQDYSALLDAALCIQLALIFALGGGGVSTLLRAGWRGVILPRLSILAPYLAGRAR